MISVQKQPLSAEKVKRLTVWLQQPEALWFREHVQSLAIRSRLEAAEKYPEGRGNEDIAREVDGLFDRSLVLKAFLELIDEMGKGDYEFFQIELRPDQIIPDTGVS